MKIVIVTTYASVFLLGAWGTNAECQTVIVNSKSSSSSVSSFEVGGHDRSSSNSAVTIDSRGQSNFVSGSGSYSGSSPDSFQGAKSSSSRNDAAIQTKGSSASTSNQEVNRLYSK